MGGQKKYSIIIEFLSFHVSRMSDESWTKTTTVWILKDRKRPRVRPTLRWRDELDSHLEGWTSVAQNSDVRGEDLRVLKNVFIKI